MMRRHKLSLLVLLLTAMSYLSHGQSEIYPGGDYVDGSGAGKVYAGPFVLTTADSGSTVSLESAATGSEDARITVIGGAAEATYYVRDHLGSVRTIVSSTGTVLERNDYYPFGKRHATGNSYPVLSSNLQKFNGKELQTVGSSSLRFLDYGARMYDPTTVRWLTQDPMAEKYYGYSPYNYCVGNPVNVIDTDGEEVRPAGSAELLMIQMTLPVEARNFVVLNKAGFIDGSVLAKCPNDSYNIYCLKQLVANEMILDVLLSDEYTWAPGNKKMKIDDHSNVNPYPMSYFGPDPEFMDPYNNIEDLSTGENGFMGKTLFPDKDGLQNSPDQNIKIVINKNLSPQGRAET